MNSALLDSLNENKARYHADTEVQDKLAEALRLARPDLFDSNMRRTWYSLVAWHWTNMDISDPKQMRRFMTRAGVPD